MFKHYCLDN